ncbi:hypothetical protein XELAEV_18008461mg [Xenopus laevis]|uniref:Uncharacterized protein n=1 Tax=Xenopus laevis TaxID=8355 RepID=A0A974I5M5_XENLA|nr:hypothetical protein XELAEV_18008461mg [Xenopus laevis]
MADAQMEIKAPNHLYWWQKLSYCLMSQCQSSESRDISVTIWDCGLNCQNRDCPAKNGTVGRSAVPAASRCIVGGHVCSGPCPCQIRHEKTFRPSRPNSEPQDADGFDSLNKTTGSYSAESAIALSSLSDMDRPCTLQCSKAQLRNLTLPLSATSDFSEFAERWRNYACYACRHLRRYLYVLDKLYFPHSHCSTLHHCFSALSDNGEELLSLTCSHILRSYASRIGRVKIKPVRSTERTFSAGRKMSAKCRQRCRIFASMATLSKLQYF